jgi:hypothetical protein
LGADEATITFSSATILASVILRISANDVLFARSVALQKKRNFLRKTNQKRYLKVPLT